MSSAVAPISIASIGLGNQFARARAADAHAQHAVAFRDQSIIFVTPSVRSKDSARPEADHGNFATSIFHASFLRLGLGQTAPRQFRDR